MDLPKFVAHFQDEEGKFETPVVGLKWDRAGELQIVTLKDPRGGVMTLSGDDKRIIKIEQI